MKSGLYFGLAAEAYHADPALSSSGIRNLLVSPLEFWVNSPALNPDYEDDGDTDAMLAGRAFHHRLLEPERFSSLYAVKPMPEDYPEAIDGGKDLQAECARLGLKKSGTIAEMCERIHAVEPGTPLWPVIKAKLLDSFGDRELLKGSVLDDIERAARMVLAHSSAAKAMTGGHSEVSIFWTDEEYGVPMKARLDYLKVKAVVDLKTFTNPFGKPLDAAVASAVANNRYDIQGVTYCDAIEQGKLLLRTLKTDAINVVSGEAPADDWIVALAAQPKHSFVFVFIEQGPVTNVRVREFREFELYGGNGMTANEHWNAGRHGYREGVRRYAECMAKFGADKPWIEDVPMRAFTDGDFPMWLFDRSAA